MYTSYIEKLEELKSKVPVEWIHGAQIDFPELIYMKFEDIPLAALQIAGEVTDTYSAATAQALIEYILELHSSSNKLIDSAKKATTLEKINSKLQNDLDLALHTLEDKSDKLHYFFGNANFFAAIFRFFIEWKKHHIDFK